MSVIPIVWVSNKDWSIDAMDRDLFYSLCRIKEVFKLFYPSLSWSGQLIPKRLIKNVPQECDNNRAEIALLFSGGLDAVCSSIRHHDKGQLLITICGSDIHCSNKHMWHCVKNHARHYAQIYSHGNAFVRSNFALMHSPKLRKLTDEIKNWWASTSQALGYTGLTAPICALNGINQLLIASTRTKACPYPYGTHPLIDNTISFAGVTVEHDAANFDRLEKIESIIECCKDEMLPLPTLRVCWGRDKDGKNCSRCEKCLRTMNELLAVGQNPQQLGFFLPVDKTMQLTRDYLADGRRFAQGLAWHWRCIQRYAMQPDHYYHLYDTMTRNYFSWLASVPIATTSSIRVNPSDHMFFAKLWEDSIRGVVNYTSL